MCLLTFLFIYLVSIVQKKSVLVVELMPFLGYFFPYLYPERKSRVENYLLR